MENADVPGFCTEYACIDPRQAKWAIDTKNEIASYLQQGLEGKFYYRMVDTVLSRDKNWVRWKAESCPPIERPPVSAQEWEGARDGADKACASAVRKIRSVPLGSLDLGFLTDTDPARALEKLKAPHRLVPLEPSHARVAHADLSGTHCPTSSIYKNASPRPKRRSKTPRTTPRRRRPSTRKRVACGECFDWRLGRDYLGSTSSRRMCRIYNRYTAPIMSPATMQVE